VVVVHFFLCRDQKLRHSDGSSHWNQRDRNVVDGSGSSIRGRTPWWGSVQGSSPWMKASTETSKCISCRKGGNCYSATWGWKYVFSKSTKF
jgi:hypothetical protein